MMATSNGLVVVFDFDKTIIDCDSDNWVVDALGAAERFDELLLELPWNSAIDRMMGELHGQGKSTEEIKEILRAAPLSPHTIMAIKSAYALGCELRIVSDANIFFIKTILDHHGLTNYFSEINTNPSYVDEDGRLRIFPYHDFHICSHDCNLGICPANMCKGKIIERIQECVVGEGKKRFIYLGDGKGDYCPSLKLSERDFMMPRKNYPVWELILSNQEAVRAEIHEWADAEDLERVLLKIIKKCLLTNDDDMAQLVPECCVLPALTSQEVLPKAVHVPN